jgi:hypothetical protein
MARHIATNASANDTLPTELRRYVNRYSIPMRASSDTSNVRPGSPVLKVTPVNELTYNIEEVREGEHPLDSVCTDVSFKVGSLQRGGTRKSPQPASINKSVR